MYFIAYLSVPKLHFAMLLKPSIKIIIADKFEIFRLGFKQIIEIENTFFEILAEASSGDELIEKVKKLRPEIVLMDVNFSLLNGSKACETIQNKYPKTKIIVLFCSEEESSIMEMIAVGGANGYLKKNSNRDDVIMALKAVKDGLPYYCCSTTKLITKYYQSAIHKSSIKEKKVEFSNQEMEVIRLICK